MHYPEMGSYLNSADDNPCFVTHGYVFVFEHVLYLIYIYGPESNACAPCGRAMDDARVGSSHATKWDIDTVYINFTFGNIVMIKRARDDACFGSSHATDRYRIYQLHLRQHRGNQAR